MGPGPRLGRFKRLAEGKPCFAQGRGFLIESYAWRIAGRRRFLEHSQRLFPVVCHDSSATNNARNASSPRRQWLKVVFKRAVGHFGDLGETELTVVSQQQHAPLRRRQPIQRRGKLLVLLNPHGRCGRIGRGADRFALSPAILIQIDVSARAAAAIADEPSAIRNKYARALPVRDRRPWPARRGRTPPDSTRRPRRSTDDREEESPHGPAMFAHPVGKPTLVVGVSSAISHATIINGIRSRLLQQWG